MNNFLDQYADITAVLITLILPLICAIALKLKTGKRTRAVPLYFLFFGPCGILTFMFFHLLDNGTKALTNLFLGSFTYNFHFYSLLLVGVVVFYEAILYMKACYKRCISYQHSNKEVLKLIAVIGVTTVPLIPVTPIAAVPAICIAISMLGLPFVRRKIRSKEFIHLSGDQATIALQ